MSPSPAEGQLAVIVGNDVPAPHYLCVFRDETTTNWKSNKFHLNLPGNTTVKNLYETVSQKTCYKYETFLLSYLIKEEEILIDDKCEDTLHDLLKDVSAKRNDFMIKQKDGKDPVTMIVDTIVPVPQESEDVESYAASFFQLEGNDSIDNKFALPSSSSSTSSFSSYSYSSQSSSTSIKSSTGFVGLVNQAMTCYLNSLLQTLFMTPEFRNALYRWRYKGSKTDMSKSIPYQLQKLFLKLETSKKRAVETTDLTKSFGWDSSEAWQQHDVQELCRVMFDALEETLKNTDQGDLINQLYQGEMKDYVKCLNCSHENSRRDNYLDISLDVRPFGSKEPHENLEKALEAFVTPETLNENNQYHCSKCDSKQDAHKGLKFISFPYLLTIQLKRFTFDYNTLQRIKLHDRLTFPFFIDLSDYVHNKEELADNIEEKGDISSTDDDNGDDDVEFDNKFKYELFSILIHSGSALGGHYYAYIKSFDDEKWYCFNDQYVSEVSEEDILKSYGGDDKFRTGFYSSNYSSSTNAYMLMYRKIDKKRNKNFIKKSKWTASLTNLCNSILQDEEDEHSKRERQKNLCKIRLLCYHPVNHSKMEAKLEVHKDRTLKEATEIAWKTFELENVIPVSQCRLVKYDDYYGSFERSYEGEEDTPIQKLLNGVKMSYGFDILLECRKKEQQFQVYEPGGTTLKVYLIDLEENEFDDHRTIHVPLTYTTQQLKERLEAETGLAAETMRVAIWKEYHDFCLLENPRRTLKLDGFYKSAKVFVEGLSEEDRLLEFKNSNFYRKLDIFNHTIKLKVTLPFEDENNHTKKVLQLNIDKRITLKELKDKIENEIDIKADLFRVYRLYSNNQEFECTRLDEQLTSYLDDTKIIIKLGRALKHGEFRIKIYLLEINKKEHTKFLMEGIVGTNLSVRTFKETQISPELEKQNIHVPLERVRIRKKCYKSPGRIYPNEYVFDKDIVVGYTSEMYVEILTEPDQIVSDDYLSIFVKRWNPSKYTLDEFEEVILYKDTKIKTLKQKLQEKSGINAEFIHIAKGRGVFPCTVSVLDIHYELEWNPVANKLGELSMGINDDGAVIYYRDGNEVIKKLTDNERREIRNRESKRTKTSGTNFYRKEKALKIYTNGNQR
ncbi:ubiquitin carboxyl-terminal hydrolase 47-like isoform X1 [Hydractinia symbiolongicarpus]|uniref:ubiquitin carboxyl-terminal hydrolase 47-like isoform X1 n=2 Tax=Hydractinia symbiolongicarpus TaxID=13093 RepID=UPI00254B0175|nr:ubiquitin carboxyl-terminal hydrolase 47-like isoform X1 [Hydractinia symbiolongicarpus]